MPSSTLAERPAPDRRLLTPWRGLWFCLGLILTAIGVVGAVVPLLPTTGPLILALACFARSSPRLEAWLLDHPRFGPVLRAWREHRTVPVSAKFFACAGMGLGFVTFWLWTRPPALATGAVAGALILCAAYVVSRQSPPSKGPPDGL